MNEKALAGQDYPALMQCADALRIATIEGAKGLKLDHKTGSLTPGKEADIVLLDAEALNVAPLNNAAGAVVTLMERTNVDTVLVAGQHQEVGRPPAGFRHRCEGGRTRGKPRSPSSRRPASNGTCSPEAEERDGPLASPLPVSVNGHG